MRTAVIEILYPGSIISVNHYKYKYYTKKGARDFMEELGWLVKPHHIEEWKLPITVRCSGFFTDKRSTPDLSNLSKCILDSLEEVSGVNDRFMRWQDGDINYTEDDPKLVIEIKEDAD